MTFVADSDEDSVEELLLIRLPGEKKGKLASSSEDTDCSFGAKAPA